MAGDDEDNALNQVSAGNLIARDLNTTMKRTTTATSVALPTPVDHPALAPFGQYIMCNTREKTANAFAVIIVD